MKYLKVWVTFRKALEPFTDDEKGRLFDAMLAYAESGAEPHFTGNERFIWASVKETIDLTRETSEKRKAVGSLGGTAAAENREAANNSKTQQNTANDSKLYQEIPNDSSKEKKRNEKKRNEKKSNERKSSSRVVFTPPTTEDVRGYQDELQSWWFDPERFIDYYQQQGWKLKNGQPMRDWKAAVRLWNARERERQQEQRASGDLPY